MGDTVDLCLLVTYLFFISEWQIGSRCWLRSVPGHKLCSAPQRGDANEYANCVWVMQTETFQIVCGTTQKDIKLGCRGGR